MRKVLKWVGIGLLALLIVLGGLWSLSRWMVPTREQKQALAVLAQKDVPEGRNAFPAIWLLPYGVPEERLEAVTAEDVERFRRMPMYDPDRTAAVPDYESVAKQRYARLPGSGADTLKCGLGEPDCLAKVRTNLVVYARWRNDKAKLIERLEAIRQYDYYRNLLPARVDVPLPAFADFGMLPTLRAFDFAEGRHKLAVDGACRDLGMWRKLSKGADSLIVSMIAGAGIRGSAELLAGMLQEMPADFLLPPSCAVAAMPPKAEELSLCNAMRGEADFFANTVSITDSPGSLLGNQWLDLLGPLAYDRQRTQAMAAPTYAWACSVESSRGIVVDKPLRSLPSPTLARFECIGNFAGCMLADAGSPGWDKYQQRSQDVGARLKLLVTLLWLREHADDKRSLAERLASRPDNLKSPTREIEIANGGKALSIRMFDDSRGETFELPLPVYLQDSAITN